MEDLIKDNNGLIYQIINKYRNYFELEDLYQVAVIGLIKAKQKYKKEYNNKFISFAYPYILGEVIHYVNNSKVLKISKNYQRIYRKVMEATELLTQRLMKVPSIRELSLFLEIDEYLISESIKANSYVDSLDRILSEENKSFDNYNNYGYYDSSIENYPLRSELEKLNSEEQAIINARYYNDLSQQETGNTLGMYQVEVSRKENKILEKLRNNIAA